MVINDLLSLSATRLLELYRTREVSPVEVTQQVFQRIAEVNPVFNVFCITDEDRAMDAARASEQRWLKGQPIGLVDGIPTTVKDLILAKDWPTLRGSLTIDP
jgi:aspartyl-tRNA(Asn)/glutamyl-tRNA(Gln) amidotransferase subunit A